jgi:hypothetical protein
LNWDRSAITDTAVDCNRPDTVLIDRLNKAALVVVIAVPLILRLPKSEAEEITKYEKLALEIKNIWNPTTYLYTP